MLYKVELVASRFGIGRNWDYATIPILAPVEYEHLCTIAASYVVLSMVCCSFIPNPCSIDLCTSIVAISWQRWNLLAFPSSLILVDFTQCQRRKKPG